jgi:hypothetical protein
MQHLQNCEPEIFASQTEVAPETNLAIIRQG